MRSEHDTHEPDLRMALAALRKGHLGAAEAIARRLLHNRPDDPFGRIAQALAAASVGEVWLDLAALRHSLAG